MISFFASDHLEDRRSSLISSWLSVASSGASSPNEGESILLEQWQIRLTPMIRVTDEGSADVQARRLRECLSQIAAISSSSNELISEMMGRMEHLRWCAEVGGVSGGRKQSWEHGLKKFLARTNLIPKLL